MKHFRSLAYTLVAVFLGLEFTVLLLSTGLNLYYVFQKEQVIISSGQTLLAKNAARDVEVFVKNKISLLHSAIRFVNPVDLTEDLQKLTLDKILGEEPAVRQISFISEQKTELSRSSQISDSATMNISLEEKDDLLLEVSQGRNYIGPVHFNEVSGEPSMIIALPILDELGGNKGALAAEVNLKFMFDLVGSIRNGKTGLVYVVDRQGYLISFGDTSRVLKRENLSKLTEVGRFMVGEKIDGQKGVEQSLGIGGAQVFSTLAAIGQPDWAVIVELPVTEAYEPLLTEMGVLVVVAVSSLFLSALMTVYVSRRLIKPIVFLRDIAREIGEGKRVSNVASKANDEIGELSRVLEEMATRMWDLQDGLETKVNARTKALEVKTSEMNRINKLMVGRELRMIELKKENENLRSKILKGGEQK